MEVALPHRFEARHYQADLFRAFFIDKKRRLISIIHRRAGKDKGAINLLIGAALQEVGTYLYLFPELNQARRVIWNGIDRDGMRFMDHIPPSLIKRTNSTEMLVEFKNGSIFQLGGSDRYDSLMGTNPKGIVFSEYSLQNPMAWHYLRPILAENNGWALFVYTPRGRNHGFELYQAAKENQNWFLQHLGANDTRRQDGTPVINPSIIQEELDAGMPEELVAQEFFCSFEAAVPGSIYGKPLQKAEEEGRVRDFEIDKYLPVYTFWDLGISDSSAIWLLQPAGHELRLIYYYENMGEGLQHYVQKLEEIRRQLGFNKYARHFAPHDIRVRELTSGRSRLETAQQFGINFDIAPNIPVVDGLQAVRNLFGRFFFHKTNCKFGIEAVRAYARAFNERTRQYSSQPVHDWSSHGCDALRYLAVSWQDFFEQKQGAGVRKLDEWHP